MTTYQGKNGRKLTGARLRANSSKRKKELGRAATETSIGETRIKKLRVRGGNFKHRAYKVETANVVDISSGKTTKVVIKDVENNSASRDYSRRRIITKGAVIVTELGNAVVTNKPGKEGYINATLVK